MEGKALVIGMQQWTGREAGLLRVALRMSMRVYAEHLGVALRTVAKWEKLGQNTIPRPDTQAILDTALARAGTPEQARFTELLTGNTIGPPVHGDVHSTGCEAWVDDIDRSIAFLSLQKFSHASYLLSRWLNRYNPRLLDSRGQYLYGRSLVLLGDLQRDQGEIIGPLSAHHSYNTAHSLFTQLGIPRRVAKTELLLTVIKEMSGELEVSARQYQQLAEDERLSECDRARARLWVGTALSKNGSNDDAVKMMAAATREFENLAEPDDWSVAHQKIALAYRGTGDLTQALRHIDIARSTGNVDSPMQRVRLDTAHAHILLSDTATRTDGLAILDATAQLARQYGLMHQVRSIHGIRQQEVRQ